MNGEHGKAAEQHEDKRRQTATKAPSAKRQQGETRAEEPRRREVYTH
mgnify:CR=1 FL=1